MEVIQSTDRKKYLSIQIDASRRKIDFCKFSIIDAQKYIDIIRNDGKKKSTNQEIGPILCLGVRNGREVDCFRLAAYSTKLTQGVARLFERRANGFRSLLPQVEKSGRSDHKSLHSKSVIGVELNPDSIRSDIWNGSFDELPGQWQQKFNIVYSNALDHAMDPVHTAKVWRSMIKPGGYLVVGYPDGQKPTTLDPVGKVNLEDMMKLFPGRLVYFNHAGSEWSYTEYVIQF